VLHPDQHPLRDSSQSAGAHWDNFSCTLSACCPCLRHKSAEKARLIVDLHRKRYNALFAQPPPFHLPNINSLLAARPPIPFSLKLDLATFYWSLLLPPTVSDYFSYQSTSPHSVLGSRRLPFGWSFSPILAQRTLKRILHSLVPWFTDSLWQFVGDLLLAHTDPHFLAFAGAFAVHLNSTSGFLLSPKSSLVPTRNGERSNGSLQSHLGSF